MVFKKIVAVFICIVTVGNASPYGHKTRVVHKSKIESKAYEYIAQQLGLCGYTASWKQSVCRILEDYNMSVSLLGGLFIGVPLGGYVAQGLSIKDVSNKIVCDVVGGLLLMCFLHVGSKVLVKKHATAGSSYRDRFTDFIKEWAVHRENVPEDFYSFFQRLFDDYQNNGGKVVCNDVMIKEIYHVFSQRFIELNQADVEYIVN